MSDCSNQTRYLTGLFLYEMEENTILKKIYEWHKIIIDNEGESYDFFKSFSFIARDVRILDDMSEEKYL